MTPAQNEAIALLAPDATVSVVEGGKVVRKYRPSVGDMIEGRIQCGNSSCISRVPQEPITSKHRIFDRDGERMVECHYSGDLETIAEVHERRGFAYIENQPRGSHFV